jgi:hypothetical protein
LRDLLRELAQGNGDD